MAWSTKKSVEEVVNEFELNGTTVFIDSNILISAFLNTEGRPAKFLKEARNLNCRLVTSQTNLRELWNVFERKFPSKVLNFQLFMSENIQRGLEIVETPSYELVLENEIRDAKDRPILRAAIFANADILLTGDKDFLDARAKIEKPKITSVDNLFYDRE